MQCVKARARYLYTPHGVYYIKARDTRDTRPHGVYYIKARGIRPSCSCMPHRVYYTNAMVPLEQSTPGVQGILGHTFNVGGAALLDLVVCAVLTARASGWVALHLCRTVWVERLGQGCGVW